MKLPEAVDDDRAIMLSDIFPTAYFGADIAEITPGDTVAVFGCGPVGQFTIASAKLLGAGRIIAVDTIPSRLEMARMQGAEVIDFNAEDPVEIIQQLTGGIGVDRAIDAVGVDATRPHSGPAAQQANQQAQQFQQELQQIAPQTNPQGDNWHPADAPTLRFNLGSSGTSEGRNLVNYRRLSPDPQVFPDRDGDEQKPDNQHG